MTPEFLENVRKVSREIAPDYPQINTDLSMNEHLWAIVESYRGLELANLDLHKFIEFLCGKLGKTVLEVLEEYEQN
jgi:hypothetical protein